MDTAGSGNSDRNRGQRLTLTNVGGTLPLGVGSGSLAILSFLPPREIDIVIKANRTQYRGYGLTTKDVARAVASGRQSGHVITHNVLIEGVSGVAMPIRPAGRDVVAAITLNMTTARLADGRLDRLLTLLREEVTGIEEQLARMPRTKSTLRRR